MIDWFVVGMINSWRFCVCLDVYTNAAKKLNLLLIVYLQLGHGQVIMSFIFMKI